MYRIALNVAISFYRKDKTSNNTIVLTEHFIEMQDDINTSSELEQNINLLQQFINELKELDKALMILYLEEKNYKRQVFMILGQEITC